MPWFGVPKMIPSGSRVVQLRHKTSFNSKCEPCLLCVIFGARSSSGTTATPQAFDISLLWVAREHVTLASAVLEGTLTECGPTNDSCVTAVNLRIYTINVYLRPRHTCERGRNLNLQSIVLGPVFRFQAQLALRLRARPALYRSSAGFPIS